MCHIERDIVLAMHQEGLVFSTPPVVIGGRAMEWYGLRTSGADIDLVVTEIDYRRLAAAYPEKRKDIYGDLGVVIGPFEIWRSIALLDYTFFAEGSRDLPADTTDASLPAGLRMVSLDRLLFSRVSAIDVPKYHADLLLLRDHFYRTFQNPAFLADASMHEADYQAHGGTIWGGRYE